MYCMACCTSNSFSTINSISISVNTSNSTSVFFKHVCHANPGAEKNELYKDHIFQYSCFENFQIHLQVIMYRFEHIDVSFTKFICACKCFY